MRLQRTKCNEVRFERWVPSVFPEERVLWLRALPATGNSISIMKVRELLDPIFTIQARLPNLGSFASFLSHVQNRKEEGHTTHVSKWAVRSKEGTSSRRPKLSKVEGAPARLSLLILWTRRSARAVVHHHHHYSLHCLDEEGLFRLPDSAVHRASVFPVSQVVTIWARAPPAL